MEIREFRDVRDPELALAWDALESAGEPNLFVTRSWVTAWSDSFARDFAPTFLVGLDEGRPVGLAPLFVDARGVARLPVNFLSHRSHFLALDDAAESFTSAVLETLRSRGLGAALLGIPSDGRPIECVRGGARSAGFLLRESSGRRSPRIEISGAWDDYLSSRPRKVTHEWERKVRRLGRAGDAVIRTPGDVGDVASLVNTFVDIDSRSWREKAGTSIGARGVERFYLDVASALKAEGRLLPYWLELDSRPVAFLLGASAGDTYFALKTSFDEAVSGLSPGVSLFTEAVREAFEGGMRCFDFVGRTARWKEEWANAHLDHSDVRLYPANARGLVSFLVDARVRPLARRIRGRRRSS